MHSPSSDQAYDATAEPHAPHIPAVGLPVIVSSSAESDEAPQVVHTAGGKHRGGGLVANWAPGAALKRPLAMQRSLSGFFGLRSSGIPDGDGPAMSAERRVSHGSTMSDGSSVLEDGTSGILYLGAQQKTAGSTAAMDVVSGWNAGERRRRLPQGASGVVLHKDLWKLDQMSETCDLPECSTVFSFTNRRHHCRMCGQIFCTPHTSFALDLWYPPIEGDGLRSGMTSRRQSDDVTAEQGVVARSLNEVEQATQVGAGDLTASTNSLLRLPSRRNLGKDVVVVKPSRVCVDCYDRVWNPEKLAARERARRTAHAGPGGNSAIDVNDSDSQASHSGFSLVLDSKLAVNNLNERVLQRSRSTRSTGRRMFSAPTSPASTSPTNQALDGAIAGLSTTTGENATGEPSRQGSRSSSLAPPGSRSRQNHRLARNASAHGALFLPAATLSASTYDSITPRPMFSPTAEALNVHSQQQRSSLSPNSSAGGSSYFPAMPPPSKPFLPGEEPNRHVNGVLSNYPLAYKPAPASGSNVTSPFTSRPPSSVNLSGIATRRMGTQGTPQGATRLPPAHMRIDLPHGGYVLDDPTSSKASSARLLTPEREWVPGAWGYAKETFDPDVETDTEDEDDDGDEVDALVKRTRSRLIVDGDIRLKTRADAPVRETTSTTGEATGAQVQSSSNTRLMPWSTF